MLIGPLGLFLFLAALVTMTRPTTEQRGAAAFLASAGALFAVSSWMFGDSNLGYARDWDLLSHAGIVFTAAGFGLFLLRRTPFRLLAACLCIAWLVSLYHTVPWVLTNASETRSLARMQTLPLGYGRTEVLVAGWYERRGDIDRARAWLERSIAAFPANPNSHAILGSIEMKQHHYDRALVDFENAVRSRPDKISYRVSAVQASFLSGQPARAVPHLHAVLRQMPGNTYPVLVLAEAYHQSGRTEEATRFYTQARAACTDILTAQPSNALVLAIYGWSLFRLGEVDESVHVLSRAIKADPRLQVARCYYGSVLRSLGRSDEARAELLQCRDLGTDLPAEIPDRAGIIAWLESP
jgi:Tfp pilus assembly protein PilF